MDNTLLETMEETLNINGEAPVRRLKMDRGLIERTESSVTVLTEDNKQLLVD
jgi:hypothetical protein